MNKVTKVKRRRRRAGEVAQRALAIRNHCLECMGYNAAEVRRCTSKKCWLYPWRLGRLDSETAEAPQAFSTAADRQTAGCKGLKAMGQDSCLPPFWRSPEGENRHMNLFIGPNCPQCEALKKRVDLNKVPDLEVHRIPDSGVPASADDAVALSEADFHDIYSVPALVSDGQAVHDVFDILEALRGAMEGGAHEG